MVSILVYIHVKSAREAELNITACSHLEGDTVGLG